MTFNEIVTEIKANAGRTDSSATANAEKAANAALRAIESERNWYWMEVTASFTLPTDAAPLPGGIVDRIPLPSGDPPGIFKELREEPHFIDSTENRVSLYPVSEDEANEIYGFSSANKGDPERYRIWAGNMYLYPAHRDNAFTLRMAYWKYSSAISDAGNNELSRRFPDLWIARGTVEYLRRLREYRAANEWVGDPARPKPGTYLYELAKAKKTEVGRILPKALGVSANRVPGQHISAIRRWRVQGN